MVGKLCTVCDEAVSKYKCPKCEAGYCSVGCFRIHKSEPCVSSADRHAAAQSTSVEARKDSAAGGRDANSNDDEDDDEEKQHRLTPEDLQKLDSSIAVKELLADPRTRALLEAVRRDANPTQAIRMHRQRPDFEQLVQAMLDATAGHR
ncbi:hypothetical protein H4R20_005613 [Coemansia guatemalensis]|uniref:HIT-type domain-containing protein n=1 Tax=Coemansia guatemalensis TaxID=2761395 RepID=A0A9W8HWE0_9FUNG|nr:hypothetical protein H4R20_005613 [Coemansia guatemalensis]